ncbi:SEL1-like repeat protein [Adlercreutzia sp. ZJ138]|uniref:SEL1-like repeat protein n=1 Tax=Adlercreutzia sp. ZJ138 TaxID=2709405 RepID=UPI0013ED5EEA|nr:SEL1-like repeat protein [Adlercreutzia sp. ZJ138]
MTQQNNTLEKHTAETLFEQGIAHLRGNNVPQDYEQAFYWLNRAAAAGSDSATIVLGELYEAGLGTPQDTEKAATLHGSSKKRSGFITVKEPPISLAAYQSETSSKKNAIRKQGVATNLNKCIECGTEMLALGTDCRCPSCGTRSYLPIVENGLSNGFAIQPYRKKALNDQTLTFSFLGECIHILKYNKHIDDQFKRKIVQEISVRIVECGVIERLVPTRACNTITVIPVPSSVKRTLQPVHELAERIAEHRFTFANPLRKRSATESKNRAAGSELAPGEITCNGNDVISRTVLLIDDTYGEGATLRACIHALKENGVHDIYYLSLCKNLYGGVKGGVSDDNGIH